MDAEHYLIPLFPTLFDPLCVKKSHMLYHVTCTQNFPLNNYSACFEFVLSDVTDVLYLGTLSCPLPQRNTRITTTHSVCLFRANKHWWHVGFISFIASEHTCVLLSSVLLPVFFSPDIWTCWLKRSSSFSHLLAGSEHPVCCTFTAPAGSRTVSVLKAAVHAHNVAHVDVAAACCTLDFSPLCLLQQLKRNHKQFFKMLHWNKMCISEAAIFKLL